jgi:benzylsuccinate CoA-transferase BbsF subunit
VGVVGAITVLSALHHRERTGEGQHIDLSQVEACTLFVGDAIAGWTLAGLDPGRTGNAHHARAPHGIYPCAEDGWIAIDCQDDRQWATLAVMVGHPGWAAEGSACAVVAGRLKERANLDAALARWTASQGHIDLMERLQASGVAAGALLSGPELLADAHLRARDAFILQERDLVGPAHYPSQPYKFRFAAAAPNRRAPYLGEHSNEVLRECLGLDEQELDELEAADVTGTLPIAAR